MQRIARLSRRSFRFECIVATPVDARSPSLTLESYSSSTANDAIDGLTPTTTIVQKLGDDGVDRLLSGMHLIAPQTVAHEHVDLSPEELAKALDRLGLTAPRAHRRSRSTSPTSTIKTRARRRSPRPASSPAAGAFLVRPQTNGRSVGLLSLLPLTHSDLTNQVATAACGCGAARG